MRRGLPSSVKDSRIAVKRLAAVLALIVLFSSRDAFGGVFTGPNAGSVAGISAFTVTVDPANGAIPVFGPSGQLFNIGVLPLGAGYGTIGQTGSTLVGSAGGGFATPAAPLGSLSFTQAPVAVTPQGPFGDSIGGAASLRASTFAAGQGAGILWFAPSFIGDSGPGATGTSARGSVMVSHGIANFTDVGGDANKVPGVAMAITGTLGGQGPLGAFVAASLVATFTVFNAAGAQVAPATSTSVIIVSDGTGPRADFVTSFSPTGDANTLTGAILFPGADNFYAWGVSRLAAPIIPDGGSVTIDATLTMVADPQASIVIDLLPPGTLLPDFGPIVSADASTPEPSSVILLGMGSLLVIGYVRRKRAG
jgi:hypothetical protein